MDIRLKESLMQAKKMINESLDVKKLEAEFAEAEKISMERKANEVMHTTNTGMWAELIPTNVLLDPLLDLVPAYSSLINMLPWNHGTDLPKTAKVPVVWEADIFVPNSEWTTWAPTPITPSGKKVATWEVDLTQGQFILDIAISKRELNYAPLVLENIVRERINKSAARTMDAFILNADTATSWNVNLDWWTPSWVYYLENNNGIRKLAISDSNTLNVWALSEQDFVDLISKIGDYGADTNNLLFILPRNVYNKALLLDDVVNLNVYWPEATIRTWRLGQIFWINVSVARDMPSLAQASWKVSSTSWSNTVWQLALIYTPAIQYGWGQALEITPYIVPWKWVVLYATMEAWFGIAYEKAGLDKTVALWINVTV